MNLDWQHMPNREWLVNTLFTLKPEHEFFSVGKGIKPEDKKKEDLIKRY